MWETRVARLFSILGQLSPYSQLTLCDLANEYGVDERTIARDINILKDAKLGVFKDSNNTIKIHRNGYRKIKSWIIG